MSDKPKRQREHPISIRPYKGLRAKLNADAKRANMSLSAYIIMCCDGKPSPRQARRTPIEEKQLGKMLAEVGSAKTVLRTLVINQNNIDTHLLEIISLLHEITDLGERASHSETLDSLEEINSLLKAQFQGKHSTATSWMEQIKLGVDETLEVFVSIRNGIFKSLRRKP